MAHDKRHLYKLSETDDFKVAEGDPDVRGWEINDPAGDRIGKIDDLIIDIQAQKVRYLDVVIEKAGAAQDDHVLIPIGAARVIEDKEKVELTGVDKVVVLECPVYKGGEVTRQHERSLGEVLSRRGDFPLANEEEGYYNNSFFDESKFYGRRSSGPGKDTRGPFNIGNEST